MLHTIKTLIHAISVYDIIFTSSKSVFCELERNPDIIIFILVPPQAGHWLRCLSSAYSKGQDVIPVP